MPFTRTATGGTIITGRASIELARLLALRSALGLEVKGIRMTRGRTVYSIVKSEFNLRGSRASVLAQFSALVESIKATGALDEVQ